jgi:hypothetical protein
VADVSRRLQARCRDCHVDTLNMRGYAEYYMVHDAVWAEAGMGPHGFLCISCLERRLGRPLTGRDLIDAGCNDPDFGAPTPRMYALKRAAMRDQGGGAP